MSSIIQARRIKNDKKLSFFSLIQRRNIASLDSLRVKKYAEIIEESISSER